MFSLSSLCGFSYSPQRDDNENIKLYDRLVAFKRKTEVAGQIYY